MLTVGGSPSGTEALPATFYRTQKLAEVGPISVSWAYLCSRRVADKLRPSWSGKSIPPPAGGPVNRDSSARQRPSPGSSPTLLLEPRDLAGEPRNQFAL